MEGSRQSSSGLIVHFQGHQVATLRPGHPPFTFGRGQDCTVRFGHNVHGEPDPHISRHAGSIRYEDGRWVVCNDSASRPFDVIVRGVANPLPPDTGPDSHSRWAVSPPGLEIRVGAPSGRYLLSVIVVAASRRSPVEPPGDGEPSTVQLREPTAHDRLLLAAKFLALPDPGDAVGNREAAEYASAVRPPDKPVTERAVEDCVGRWSRKLQEFGATGVNGRDNINQLGRQLLAWGIVRQEDRLLLRPL